MALLAVVLVLFVSIGTTDVAAQEQQPGVVLDRSGSVPVYRVTVVQRMTKAINYRHRSGPTEVNFQGTDLMPQARGQILVNSKQDASKLKQEWKT